MKKFLLVLILLSVSLFGRTFTNFSYNGVDYVWNESQNYEKALTVYLEAFRTLYKELKVEKSEEHFKETMKHELELAKEHPDYIHWCVARKEGQIVGIAIFEFLNYPAIYVRELAVLPAFQHQGIGTQLSYAPVRDDPQIEKISIVTRHVNTTAVGFYKAIGFSPSSYMHPEYSPSVYCGMEWVNKGEKPSQISH
jgi:ribosomal protein S18 acetylase RimI-like enzyme